METAQDTQRQSRVGKRPMRCPRAWRSASDATIVKIKGPKGSPARKLPPLVSVKKEGEELIVSITPNAGVEGPKFQGLTRALVANMVQGVSAGYAQSLDLLRRRLPRRAQGQGSHLVARPVAPGEVPAARFGQRQVEIIDEGGTKRPRLHLDSCDKELLGQVAARIRSFRPPEPYKGKGVRYVGEKIEMKAGKAGKTGAKGK